jgi:hypothetical protein
VKQKDVALIIVIVVISGIVSLFLSKMLFSSSADRQQQVDVVQPINGNFQTPSSSYFNASSIDPTQLIKIGNANNSNPFNGTQSNQ